MQPLEKLPEAPRNVRFEYHPNECYDWGTMGWVLDNRMVDVNLYTYFILMNSSVRGPFLPPYLWVHSNFKSLFQSLYFSLLHFQRTFLEDTLLLAITLILSLISLEFASNVLLLPKSNLVSCTKHKDSKCHS